MDLNSNGFDQSAELPNSHRLKSSIADPTDFFFPVYGFKDQSHFAEEFGYHGLVESPGMAYIVNTNSHDDMPNAVLMKVVSCWPAMALLFMITYLAGLIIWSVVSQEIQRYLSIVMRMLASIERPSLVLFLQLSAVILIFFIVMKNITNTAGFCKELIC